MDSKIQEVKRAFEDLRDTWERGAYPLEKKSNVLSALQAAINALDSEPEPIDLSDLREGDEVEDFRKGWGTIVKINRDNSIVVDTGYTYPLNGKFSPDDLRPSIINVRRKKRMVKKEVGGCLVLSRMSTPFYSPLSVEAAKREYKGSGIVGFIPINESYEEPE